MTYDDLSELHYITPIDNLPSIEARGILSHQRAKPLTPASVSSSAVRARRAKKKVPGGRPLHEYVNLYFHARNPMMYVIRHKHSDLCVIRVKPGVIKDVGNVVITDRNAASDYVLFADGASGLQIVDRGLVFARYWTHNDPIEAMRRKSIRCAEVLVPDQVDMTHVRGVYVSCIASEQRVNGLVSSLKVAVHPDLFFQ